MNVLFINDSSSNSNWGDRAAAVSLMELISGTGALITHSISEYQLFHTLLDQSANEPAEHRTKGLREAAKHLAPPVVLDIRRRILPNVDSSRTRRLIPQEWQGFAKACRTVLGRRNPWPVLLQAITEADVAVIHGNGAMVGNGIIPRTQLFLTYLIKKHFGKPVIIVNHTADFDHPKLREMAENVYPLFDDIVFRDTISLRRCQALCAGRFAPDSAFWFRPARPEQWTQVSGRLTYFDVWPDSARFNPSKPYVCIGGSSALRAELGRLGAISSAYIHLIEHMRSQYSGEVVLTGADMIDVALFRPVAQKLSLPLIGLTTPVQQAADILGNADAYIGGRWHPSILALRGGTPIVPLSAKTFKTQALAEMAGLPATVFDVAALEESAGAIGEQFVRHLEAGSALRSRLCTWADAMAERCSENVSYLQDRASS